MVLLTFAYDRMELIIKFRYFLSKAVILLLWEPVLARFLPPFRNPNIHIKLSSFHNLPKHNLKTDSTPFSLLPEVGLGAEEMTKLS